MKNHIIARIKNKILTKPLMRKYGYYALSFNDAPAVIMFHKIVKDSNQLQSDKFYSDFDTFKKFIKYIKDSIGFVSPNELFNADKGVLLTFDDATIDLYETVFPVLKEMNIPFVVFVVVNYLNKEGYVTSEQLLEMSKNELCHIGAHTLNHPKLRFERNAEFEIKNSIIELEKIINEKIKYFAYPYGSIFACSRKNIKSASETNIEFAFSTVPGYLNEYAKNNKYFLPRFNGDKLVKGYKEKGELYL